MLHPCLIKTFRPLLLLTMTWAFHGLARASDSRPNIVLIMCDDMGFSDLSCYGSEIPTPNLDQLAAGGLRFTDFHNNAKCSETRASLMTGLWHQQSNNLAQPGHVTLAEVLGSAGYRTYMSGKWHLDKTPPDRGFDRYFGFLSGAINFFTGMDWQANKNLMRLDRNVYQPPADFYSTNAFTDFAINFLKSEFETPDRGEKPFFLYLAHNAPHFPLHALPEDIERFRGAFSQGWDAIRKQRHQRLLELGIIDHTWPLSERDPKVESWNQLTDKEKDFLEPMMEVYAAMIHRLDQNIGRLTNYLKSTGQLDNTLILFLSDNGACPYERLRTDVKTPGPVDSDIAYDARWANMCNTPLRLYKQYAHQGGTLTPMIAHWPAGIKAQGELCRFPSHLVDIMPTLAELAGANYPEKFNQQKIHPMEGTSLVSVLQGKGQIKRHLPIFWEFSGNHAVRSGEWKLVAERGKPWELYHLEQDRSETVNLATQNTEILSNLADTYEAWAARVGARSHEQSMKMKPSKQSQLFDLETILDPSSAQ